MALIFDDAITSNISLVGGLSIGLFLKLIKKLRIVKNKIDINKWSLNLNFDTSILNTDQMIINGKMKITYFGDITDAPIIE